MDCTINQVFPNADFEVVDARVRSALAAWGRCATSSDRL